MSLKHWYNKRKIQKHLNFAKEDIINPRNSPNDIFVFGSNLAGLHAGGAADCAANHYGAQWGVGHGFTGRAYAIPTLDFDRRKIPLDILREYVLVFIHTALHYPQMTFHLTPIGCGIAGYSVKEIAPLFEQAVLYDVQNIIYPKQFLDYFATHYGRLF